MTTSFSSLPIVDLGHVKLDGSVLSDLEQERLSKELYDVFATTGFAYRGYFPVQPLAASDNLKEGFEVGPTELSSVVSEISRSSKFDLSEPNVWPSGPHASQLTEFRPKMEQLYSELQSLSSQLLSLLAQSLGKRRDYFTHYLQDSLSTLRLLHYPPAAEFSNGSSSSLDSGVFTSAEEPTVKLSCTPHTDSGILTLLHQDSSGGLEVLNSSKQWVPAPYIAGSLVVNIGDLMHEVSGGRFVATMHRVRAPPAGKDAHGAHMGFGRFSVPFFFEPGEMCKVKSIDEPEEAEGAMYGTHVREKMRTWVEYESDDE